MNVILSIIYVYYNTPEEIKDSIKSLVKTAGDISYEIIVVDNASPKKFPKLSKSLKLTLIKNNKNNGYGKAINQATKVAKGKYLLLLNPDTKITNNSIRRLLERIEKGKKIGVIGPQLVNENGKVLPSISSMPYLPKSLFIFSFLGKLWPTNRFMNEYHKIKLDRQKEHEVDVVGGACMLVRKSLFDVIGGFDERFFMYFEEADFCFRIKKTGHKVLYYPEAKIVHLIGRSTQNKDWIEKTFEQSRFKFFNKYHKFLSAVAAELFLRMTKVSSLILLLILLISVFLNFYKLSGFMMFIGDMGRDYLAARDMILSGKIPLVGITSSVVWLHQGPISIYLIALAFLLSNFNPIAPALLYGFIGVISTFLVYKLGSLYFNRQVGFLSSIFYATSPLVVINTRMPYHTALIPFFACLFFIVLYEVFVLNKSKFFPLLFFLFGLLLQVELSNGVLIFLILFLLIVKKIKIKLDSALKALLGFALGILPFIIYDINHKFVQTIGFPLWVINRIRLFLGLTVSGNSTTVHFPYAVHTIFQQLAGILFPISVIVVYCMLGLITFVIFRSIKTTNFKNQLFSLYIIVSGLVISLLGFLIHTTPGIAYFPLVYPLISILVGLSFYSSINKFKLSSIVFILLITINGFSLLTHDYFLNTKNNSKGLPPYNYKFGTTWTFQDDIVKFIVKDADGKTFQLKAAGTMGQFATGIDSFEYLTWWRHGKVIPITNISYSIYQSKKEIGSRQQIVYSNGFYYLTKDEIKY